MNYKVYKMEFRTSVHFGRGMLNESDFVFKSDSIFSSLFIESVKLNCQEKLYKAVKEGCIRFSDLFPYIDETYYVPKPMLYVDSAKNNRGDSKEKKRMKKLKYISVDDIEAFLDGSYKFEEQKFGENVTISKAFVRTNGDAEPYHVGMFRFCDNAGLYVIVGYKDEGELRLIEYLLESLSYTGIGGKKSQGMGKYTLKYAKNTDTLLNKLNAEDKRVHMLLSTCMAKDDELESCLENSSYSLTKRSGFIDSADFSDNQVRKRDFYMFNSGSCFINKFDGDIFDLSPFKGKHPVYRYAKSLFIGVK